MSDPLPRWDARFIAGPDAHTEAGRAAPYFRTEFTVGADLVSARLFVTALGVVETRLNGSVVGDEVLCPGWTAYSQRLVVSDHDVSSLVRPGVNAVGAIVGEGWAVGRIGFQDVRNRWADRPMPTMQLELVYPDRTELLITDDRWRTATGAVRCDGIYDGEHYDARLHPQGWDEPGFDDSSWMPVSCHPVDPGRLVARSAPPIRRCDELPPVAIRSLPSGEYLVDFGQVFSGWVRLSVAGEAGTEVTIRHCELLVDGQPEYETNRTALATDRYTLAGGGPEVWEPGRTFHGFRYAVIGGWPGALSADQVTGIVIHSDLERTGWFECSDDGLNQLHRNIVWSWRGNSVGLPTDCPQRDERLGWTGDINAFGPTAAFLFDVRAFLGSWLDDLAAEQHADGSVPVVVPDVISMFQTPTALWGDVVVGLPWTLYQYYGDTELLRRWYPSMSAFVACVERQLEPDGLWRRGFQFGDWVDPDSPPDQPSKAKAEASLVATAFLYRTAVQMADIADLCGHPEDAARFATLRDKVRVAFRNEWVAPSGRLANESQTSYALAICFGLLDPGQERRAGQRLVELVRDKRYAISTGFAGTPWVSHALTRTGHDDVVYDMLARREPPSFLYPVTMGATTIWERWDAVLPDGTLNSTGMTSLNHYALGAIGDWMHQRIGGICALAPGFSRVQVAPRPGGGLTWARCRHVTVHGPVSVSWSDDGLERSVEVEVPDSVRAHVVLPDHPDGLVVDVDAGRHRWTYAIEGTSGYGLHTRFEELQANEPLWAALFELMGTVMEGVPDLLNYLPAGGAPHLEAVIEHLPGDADALRTRLAALFARFNQ